MKSTNGILWYFFLIYATSVIVNFSHYHKTFTNDTDQLTTLGAAKCLIQGQGRNDVNSGQNNCRLSFQYNKETVLNLLKSVMNRKEFNKFYKLSLKNGSKKGTSDLVNITLDLKPLFSETDLSNTSHLDSWHSFYIFISIILITFITPLWPLTNYIYIITLTSMVLFSITLYLQFLKLIVFSIVYLITFKKYKFWLLPNLNRDVGFINSFFPLYEVNTSTETSNSSDEISSNDNQEHDKIECNQLMNKQIKCIERLEQINLKQNNSNQIDLNETSKPVQTNQKELKNRSSIKTDLIVNKNESKGNTVASDNIKSTTITEFMGNDQLPTIVTTLPNPKFKFESASNRLEIIDLHNEQEKANIRMNVIDDEKQKSKNGYLENDYTKSHANIIPSVSYLNVNEVRRRQHLPTRERISSNRSDDGFEILNNDFLKNSSSPKKEYDELFACSKQNL